MKILLLNAMEKRGGAAIAANRLHVALRKTGVDSRMRVIFKESEDASVAGASKLGILLARIRIFLARKLTALQHSTHRIHRSLNLFPSLLQYRLNSGDHGLIHLHWVNYEMISLRGISAISKPLVWTLHDSWVLCGTEHHPDPNSPPRWKDGYHFENRGCDKGFDLDRMIWSLKKKYWKNLDAVLVTPSDWLKDMVKASDLFCNREVVRIYNGIDLNIFSPKNKKTAKKKFGFSPGWKIVLFGADAGANNYGKGFDQLKKIADKVKKNSAVNCRVVVFGSGGEEAGDEEGGIIRLGHVEGEENLAMLYSAADLFVLPTMWDNLPNTLIEAHACALPCISCDVGGVGEIIEDQKTGFLVPPGDAEALLSCLVEILNNDEQRKKYSVAARKRAEERFDLRDMAENYRRLYKGILEGK